MLLNLFLSVTPASHLEAKNKYFLFSGKERNAHKINKNYTRFMFVYSSRQNASICSLIAFYYFNILM